MDKPFWVAFMRRIGSRHEGARLADGRPIDGHVDKGRTDDLAFFVLDRFFKSESVAALPQAKERTAAASVCRRDP